MNTFKIFVFFLLLSTVSAFSQYDYYDNISRYGGVNRNIGREHDSQRKPTPEEIEKVRNERVEKFVTKLKADLTLDDLQVVVIRNELTANAKSMEIIMKKETIEEEKSKELKAIMDKTDVAIKSYLNKTQKEKYVIMMEDLKANKKEKKSKKKDKEKEKTTEE